VFTGIIEEVGEVVEASGGTLRIRVAKIRADTKLGDSIAINGVDLTVSAMTADEMTFNVMPESFRVTALGRLAAGSRVNLERSVRAADRLSGHVVRGVVEGTGTLAARRQDGDAVVLTYEVPKDLLDHMIVRGPICVDGVSLTVIAKTPTAFSVSVVDFTQHHTTLLETRIGDRVNVETDIMMRYVAQALAARGVVPPSEDDPKPR
jgi:riboflavin synthase